MCNFKLHCFGLWMQWVQHSLTVDDTCIPKLVKEHILTFLRKVGWQRKTFRGQHVWRQNKLGIASTLLLMLCIILKCVWPEQAYDLLSTWIHCITNHPITFICSDTFSFSVCLAVKEVRGCSSNSVYGVIIFIWSNLYFHVLNTNLVLSSFIFDFV